MQYVAAYLLHNTTYHYQALYQISVILSWRLYSIGNLTVCYSDQLLKYVINEVHAKKHIQWYQKSR